MKTIKVKAITEKNTKVVVFYFPFKVVSGGPIYLSNLAIHLSKRQGFTVAYIDYEEGVARELLAGSKVHLLKYQDDFLFKLFPDNEILLITPIYWGNRVPILNAASKIIFFNWHNLCIPSLRTALQCDTEILKVFLRMVSANRAEFYCDKAHWAAQEKFGVSFIEKYVPITIPERGKPANTSIVDKQEINLAIVGRLVIDKIYAIVDLIDNLAADVTDSRRINIYVIGDGDYRKWLEGYLRPANIRLIFCGTLEISEINALMADKADVLFAMGTSVLEGAAIGMPAVVIPNDVQPFRCDRYAYLYECNSYLLGWAPEQIDLFGIKTHTVGEIIQDIYVKNRKKEIGDLCLAYYRKNHSDNTELFLQAIQATTLTYEEYHTIVSKVSADAKEWAKENIKKILQKQDERKLVIWGAGKGGKTLLKKLKEMDITVDFFVDQRAAGMKEIRHIPIRLPQMLFQTEHLVLVSLLTYDFKIVEELSRRGFKKNEDYLYVYFPNY